jgi:hypothetical protein
VIGGLVVLAPQRFVAKRSSAMKIAQFYLPGKILPMNKAADPFLVVGKLTRRLGLFTAVFFRAWSLRLHLTI